MLISKERVYIVTKQNSHSEDRDSKNGTLELARTAKAGLICGIVVFAKAEAIRSVT